MSSGPACFAILLKDPLYATHLPHKLKFFVVRCVLSLSLSLPSRPRCVGSLRRMNGFGPTR